jgi:flagellar capping protein FliD
MQDLVDAYNSTIKFLSSNENRGVGVLQQMKRMIQPPVSESSMAMIGLSVKADGTLSFDQNVFNKAMDASPSLMGSITERVASGIKQDAQRGLDAPSASLVGSAAKQQQQNLFGSSAFSSSQMDSISMMSMYNRLGAYNMSNFYAVGMMMNMFV